MGELEWQREMRKAPQSAFSPVTDKNFVLGDKQTLPEFGSYLLGSLIGLSLTSMYIRELL